MRLRNNEIGCKYLNTLATTSTEEHLNSVLCQIVDKALLLQGFAIVGTAFLI